MYQKAGEWARCPDLKQGHFPGIPGRIAGSKSVQVKGWVAFATSAFGHRPAKPGEYFIINFTINKYLILQLFHLTHRLE